MKILSIFMLFFFLSCKEKSIAFFKLKNQPKEFSINYGSVITIIYKFENTGDKPLKIKSVHADCGCTKVEFPTKFFNTGEVGQIRVKFDSKLTKFRTINKAILVESNTKPILHALYLKGSIIYSNK